MSTLAWLPWNSTARSMTDDGDDECDDDDERVAWYLRSQPPCCPKTYHIQDFGSSVKEGCDILASCFYNDFAVFKQTRNACVKDEFSPRKMSSVQICAPLYRDDPSARTCLLQHPCFLFSSPLPPHAVNLTPRPSLPQSLPSVFVSCSSFSCVAQTGWTSTREDLRWCT